MNNLLYNIITNLVRLVVHRMVIITLFKRVKPCGT